ncbi:MAG: DUF4249 domain-containing protein [Bacteroidales bacterium]|nr:DUF4249 domain-containing protein [Bacteroidales bacterium]
MKRKTIIFLLAFATIVISSCSKEIDLNYRNVDKVTVIEGFVTNEGVSVVVTTTRDISDTTHYPCVNDAVVSLSSSSGWSEELVYSAEEEAYISPSEAKGVPGTTYSLSVTREGQTFTSQAYMHEAVEITEGRFCYYKVLFLKQLLFSAKIQDIADEDNFYHYIFYRDGERYTESVMTDKKAPGGELDLNIMCVDEESTMSDWDMDMVEERFVNEGDEFTLEVRSIDEQAYNYLYSLGMSGMTSSNPIANFTGGALGYFSAHSITRLDVVYHQSEVGDFEE